MTKFRFLPLGLVTKPELLNPIKPQNRTTHETELQIIEALTPWTEKMKDQHAYHFEVHKNGTSCVIRAAKFHNEIKLINMSGAIKLTFPLRPSLMLEGYQEQTIATVISQLENVQFAS